MCQRDDNGRNVGDGGAVSLGVFAGEFIAGYDWEYH